MTKYVVLTCLLLLAPKVLAAAEGLVVLQDTPLFADSSNEKNSSDVETTLARHEILLPGPGQSKGKLVVATTCFSFKHAGVAFEEDLDPTRYEVRVFIETKPGKYKWKTGWVNKSDVKSFTYEPTTDIVNCGGNRWDVLTRSSYTDAGTLTIDELAFLDFHAPEIDDARVFNHPYDDVWAALVEVLAERQIPFELVDKDSGLLTSEPVLDTRTDTMVCATAFDERNRVVFNIYAKGKESRTRVKVNATFRALRDDSPINCYSNGVLEAGIFDDVEVLLTDEW